MSDAVLTNEQATKLLNELATYDGFRTCYQEKPAAALVEIGIPHETVIKLSAACLAPMQLADKATFQATVKEFSANSAKACLSMITPQLQLGGDSGRRK